MFVFPPVAEALPVCLAFDALRCLCVTVLRRRALAGWPLALERRRIAHPKAGLRRFSK